MTNDRCRQLIARGGWTEDRLRNSCRWPIGPLNTLSNLAYPLVGAALVVTGPTAMRAVFAACLLGLGLGSAAYHAWKTFETNQLDWAGMVLVFVALMVHGVAPASRAMPLLVGLSAACGAWLFAYPLAKAIDIDVLTGICLYMSAVPVFVRARGLLFHGPGLQALVALVLFTVAYAIWQLDQHGASGRWGHAVWHVLTALAIGFLFVAQGG